MFAEVVAVEQGLGDAVAVRREGEGAVGHAGDGFEDDGVVGGVVGCVPQHEGARGRATRQAGTARGSMRAGLLEALDDGEAGFVDVAAADGFVGRAAR